MPILRPLVGLDKVEIIDIARRIGTFDVSKIGSLNIVPSVVAHYLGCNPGGSVGFYIGEDKESLILRKLDKSTPIVPSDVTKKHQEYLDGEDNYTAEEWAKKKKQHKIS